MLCLLFDRLFSALQRNVRRNRLPYHNIPINLPAAGAENNGNGKYQKISRCCYLALHTAPLIAMMASNLPTTTDAPISGRRAALI